MSSGTSTPLPDRDAQACVSMLPSGEEGPLAAAQQSALSGLQAQLLPVRPQHAPATAKQLHGACETGTVAAREQMRS